jgi:hypothetical protein
MSRRCRAGSPQLVINHRAKLDAVSARWWTALAVTALVAAAGCGTTATTVSGTGTVAQPAAVRDGGFEFVVRDVAQMRQVGNPNSPGLSITAKGVFVVVTLWIRNAGDGPLTFFDRYQTLIASSGDQYSASMAADIYGNLGIPSTKIAPGDALTVHLAFDVPTGAVPAKITLRQSDSSAGVTVALP